jgi:hypothetical protein
VRRNPTTLDVLCGTVTGCPSKVRASPNGTVSSVMVEVLGDTATIDSCFKPPESVTVK